jgi:hypothetical protein
MRSYWIISLVIAAAAIGSGVTYYVAKTDVSVQVAVPAPVPAPIAQTAAPPIDTVGTFETRVRMKFPTENAAADGSTK